MTSTLFVQNLTPEETDTLENLYYYHPKPASRKRAHIILLNSQNYSVSDIVPILKVTQQTIAATIKNWDKYGVCALFDIKRSGRPSTIPESQKAAVLEMVYASPRSLKSVLANVENKLGLTIGVSALKRLCKRSGLT
jgi:transposase